MDRFAALSAQMAPVISDLRAAAPDLSRFLIALGPFSQSSNAALKSLGNTSDIGRNALVNAKPVAERLARFTSRGRKVVRNLATLFTSIDQHRGIERFLDTLYYVALSTNGFDEIGHYLRNNLVVTICSGYVITPTVGCSANFVGATGSSSGPATSRSLPEAIASGLVRMLDSSPRARRDRKRRPSGGRPAKRDGGTQTRPRGRSAPADRGPTGRGPTDGETRGGATGPGATGQSGPPPSAPSSQRPPSDQQGPGGADPLLDYYLGGSQ
jgi:hypothetical protein